MLKLRYEIEAIKKEKNLKQIDEEKLFPYIEQPTLTSEDSLGISSNEQLTFWSRFSYGAVGSLLPIFLNILLAMDMFITPEIDVFIALGMITRLITFAVVSGIGGAFLTKGNADKQVCFLIGLSISLLFSLLLTGAAYNSTTEILIPENDLKEHLSDLHTLFQESNMLLQGNRIKNSLTSWA